VLEGLREGKEVEFTWQVIQEDIDNGERQDCNTCPIAISLARVLPGLAAEVFPDEIVLWEEDEGFRGRPSYTADMSDDGQVFIFAFDDAQPVEPLTLTVKFKRLAA
jgi:hypothetical protein